MKFFIATILTALLAFGVAGLFIHKDDVPVQLTQAHTKIVHSKDAWRPRNPNPGHLCPDL